MPRERVCTFRRRRIPDGREARARARDPRAEVADIFKGGNSRARLDDLSESRRRSLHLSSIVSNAQCASISSVIIFSLNCWISPLSDLISSSGHDKWAPIGKSTQKTGLIIFQSPFSFPIPSQLTAR